MQLIKTYLAVFMTWCTLVVHSTTQDAVTIAVLGVAQDAGYPQLNCYKPHCQAGWHDPAAKKYATALGLIDHENKQKYLFEATPDIREQMHHLHQLAPDGKFDLQGIFLTHGHMGHYTGLMHLGREAAGTHEVPVYVMPRFKAYLKNNGPWSQLVSLKNILLKGLSDGQMLQLSPNISIKPVRVPHRDEFTETVGYYISGPSKTALFIPDIDKWQKWERDIVKEIQQVDYALLDATFFANGEIPNRDMSEIPHPFVVESMALFKDLPVADKKKIIFIHFNHTNPLINEGSDASQQVLDQGFQVAYRGMTLKL